MATLRNVLRPPLVSVGLAVAGAALLMTVAPAAAQQPGPYLPPNARGFQRTMILQDYWRRAAEQRVATAAPAVSQVRTMQPAPVVAPLQVVVTLPRQAPVQEPAPAYVSIRGPDGQVRTFPLEGGRDQSNSVIVLRPGESATFRLAAAPPK